MAEFPDEKMQCRPVLLGMCQLETEAGELEIMDSKRHIIQHSVNSILQSLVDLLKLAHFPPPQEL